MLIRLSGLVGLSVLFAPLGTSFILGVLFCTVAGAYIGSEPNAHVLPPRWIAALLIFSLFLVASSLGTWVSAHEQSVAVLDAVTVLAVSTVIYVIAFRLGATEGTNLRRLLIAYLITRVATSALVPPISTWLVPLLEGKYLYEDYRAVGLGVRYIFPGDVAIIAAYLLRRYLLLRGEDPGWLKGWLVFLAAVATFSRFVVIAVLLAFIVDKATRFIVEGRVVTLAITALVLLAMSITTLYVLPTSGLAGLIEARVIAASSNSEKLIQYEMFSDRISRDPLTFLFGSGIGAYLEQYVRDPDYPFQYEAQVFSFAYQLGVIGVLLWFAVLAIPFLSAISAARHCGATGAPLAAVVVCLLIVFLLSGFVNPTLLLPQNLILFCIIGKIATFNNSNLASREGVKSARAGPPEFSLPRNQLNT